MRFPISEHEKPDPSTTPARQPKESDMETTERRMTDLILAKLRVWDPSLDEDVLDRPNTEIDLDSLDALEITHLLEREFKVKADQETTSGFVYLRDYIHYFNSLVDRP
jgi:acyl carrier protein